MKFLCAASLMALASAAAVRADGVPFDRVTGRVTVPRTVLHMSAEQRAQVSQTRRLTLTPRQHERLARLCPVFPNEIGEVLSYRYGDCTCCVGHPYALLLPGGASVAVPHSEAEDVSRYGVRERPSFAATTTAGQRSRWFRFWRAVFRRD
ncbi:MAG TPA: hypothetical protein DIT64_03715 [Verrucomicrobiales bacterium]|nr:hypothetical protein [Verrucomicrobiales bacterium]